MLSARFFILSTSLRTRISLRKLQVRKPLSISQKIPLVSFENQIRLFGTEQFAPKEPDSFGDIAGNKHERQELDEDEKEIEEFDKNEHPVPRRFKPRPSQYAKMIEEHRNRGDMDAAMKVLDLVKENRDKPTYFMYNLLIKGFADQGNIRMCLKLFTMMKKKGLKINGATYTSVLNACANSNDSQKAINAVDNIRLEFIQKSVVLNEAHYNVMIKAYGKHKRLVEAFSLVDEMIDKKIRVGEGTFNSLMFAAITDKENGLKHSLTVWHLMNRWRIKPSIMTYNLLLRAIRDTKLGNLKENDMLVNNVENTRVLVGACMVPDLLARPPVVSSLLHDAAKSQDVPALQSASAVANIDEPKEIVLEEIHKNNKLILFGGYSGFIERMIKDGVTPDARTITLMLDVVPDSLSIENNLIQLAREKKITLDVDFFNMLIKKRSFRRDYKNAKAVLDDIQRSGVYPDIITWGVLALGCQSWDDARALLDGMETTGHTINTVIAGALLGNACSNKLYPYILDIMKRMEEEKVKPSDHVYKILDKFVTKVEESLKEKRKNTKKEKWNRYKENFENFKIKYQKWREHFKEDEWNMDSKGKNYRNYDPYKN